MNDRIYIRTVKAGEPRELMVGGVLSGQMTLAELSVFASGLILQLGEEYKAPIKIHAAGQEIVLTWNEALQLALSSTSSMSWG
jgi:hypothetical protein